MSCHLSNSHPRRCATGFNLVAALILFAAIAQPISAQAQDDWEWRGTIYAWLPTIEGKTVFPTDEDSPDLETDTSNILDNLDFTFMGTLGARKGSWGFFTDILYLDVGGNEKASRDFTIGPNDLPAGVDANVRLDLKSTVWSISGTYNLSANKQHESDLLLGARMMDMKQTLKWTFNGSVGDYPLPERTGSSKVTATNWDAIIGISGYAFMGDESRWVIPYYLDVGTGDSDLTWQAMAGIGYQFGWGTTVLTYRYLDYDMDSDSLMADLTIKGPMLGVSFQW